MHWFQVSVLFSCLAALYCCIKFDQWFKEILKGGFQGRYSDLSDEVSVGVHPCPHLLFLFYFLCRVLYPSTSFIILPQASYILFTAPWFQLPYDPCLLFPLLFHFHCFALLSCNTLFLQQIWGDPAALNHFSFGSFKVFPQCPFPLMLLRAKGMKRRRGGISAPWSTSVLTCSNALCYFRWAGWSQGECAAACHEHSLT